MAAFASIVEQGELRLSSAFGAADYGEVLHGIKIFDSICTEILTTNPRRLEQVRAFLGSLVSFHDIFVASFSADADTSSQWKDYADGGRGVAIGFDPNSFGAKLHWRGFDAMPTKSISLDAVEYDPTKQRDKLEAKAKWLAWEKIPSVELAAFGALAESAFFKQHGYESEQEWRLVYVSGAENPFPFEFQGLDRKLKSIRFRSTQSSIVPYVELPLQKKPSPAITDVVLGPMSGANGTQVAQFLTTNGFENVKIDRSKLKWRR